MQIRVRLAIKICHPCVVNNYPEGYCPPIPLPLLPGYHEKLGKRTTAAKGILPPTLMMILKKYYPPPVRQSPVPPHPEILYARHRCRALNQSHRGMIRPRVILSKHQLLLVLLLFHTFSVLVANAKKLLYTVANSARGLLNRETKQKKVWQRFPLSPRCSFGEKIKVMRRIYKSRCYPGRRYPGLGPSRVRTRIPSTRRLGQRVSLRKILRFRVR